MASCRRAVTGVLVLLVVNLCGAVPGAAPPEFLIDFVAAPDSERWILDNEAVLVAQVDQTRGECMRSRDQAALWELTVPTLLAGGRFATALRMARVRLAQIRDHAMENDPAILDCLVDVARAQRGTGDLGSAEATLRELLRLSETRFEGTVTGIRALAMLRDIHAETGRSSSVPRISAKARRMAIEHDRRFRALELRPLAYLLEARFIRTLGGGWTGKRLATAAARLVAERGPLTGELSQRVPLLIDLAEECRELAEPALARRCATEAVAALEGHSLPHDSNHSLLIPTTRIFITAARWLRAHAERESARRAELALERLLMGRRKVSEYDRLNSALRIRGAWTILSRHYDEFGDVKATADLQVSLARLEAHEGSTPSVTREQVDQWLTAAEAAAAHGDELVASQAVGEALQLMADRPRDRTTAEQTERAAEVLAGLGEADRAAALRRRVAAIRREIGGTGGR